MSRNIHKSFEYEKEFESEKWVKEIPFFNFKPEWQVKAIPPFCGAVVRFMVKHNDKEISVYLDCYDNLGVLVNLIGKYIHLKAVMCIDAI